MKDYVGQWFEIYRRLNEPADILFEIKHDQNTETVFFPHEKADGAGALFTLAEERQWQIKNVSGAQIQKKISRFKYFINCLQFLYWTKPRTKNIWAFQLAKAVNMQTLTASHTYSESETQKLISQLQKKSLNAILFKSLNQSLAFKFNFDSALKSWWIPVNMRTDLGLDINDSSLKKNYVSNFTIDVNHLMSLNDYQSLISKSLKQQKHWATWWWQHLGKYLPESVLEKIAVRNMTNNFYVGTFTNLGEWVCSDKDSQLTVFANPIISHPIGASAIIWNGCLSIALRTYPTFPVTQKELDLIISDWVSKVKSNFDL